MGYDIVSGLKFAFGGLHDRQVLLWSAFFGVVMVASWFVSLALMFILPTLVAVDFIAFGMPISTIAAAAFTLIYICALALAAMFFHFRFCMAGMRLAGYEDKSPNFMQFFLVALKSLVVNLFSWYDKRVLAVILVMYAITVLWMAAGYFVHPLMVAAGFGLLAFSILVHYIGVFLHSIRTSFAPLIYIREGQMGALAPKRSFTLVKGQTVDVFVALLGGALVFGMAALPAIALSALIVGYLLLAVVAAAGTLYFTHVFRHFDQKGVAQKKKEKEAPQQSQPEEQKQP